MNYKILKPVENYVVGSILETNQTKEGNLHMWWWKKAKVGNTLTSKNKLEIQEMCVKGILEPTDEENKFTFF